MPPSSMTEANLVQQTTTNYLHDALGWDTAYAYNTETYGPQGTFGRISDRQMLLPRFLLPALEALNPGLPQKAYTDAMRDLETANASQSPLQINQEKFELLRDGIPVQYRAPNGRQEKKRLRVFDFDTPENNHFLAVRELWIKGPLYRRRADVVGFVNGVPLLFMELKNVHKDIETAYTQNLADYKDTIPHAFHHNAIVILGNGIEAKLGTAFSRYEYFQDWKRLDEDDTGVVDMETLLRGVCDKKNFLDLFENFILFNNSPAGLIKILAHNHQFLGVNRAIRSVEERTRRQGKLGVFWHTQGSGKSYSIVFFTRKIRRKLGTNFTFLLCTDRDDLDNQLYKTFAGCGLADNDRDPCRASDGRHLQAMLGRQKAFIFTLIQKFNQDVSPDAPYSDRDDIIVITDEAHRTQYGRLSLNMRNALPKASYIGFTGTPLFKDDEITRRIFGDYVSTYDFQRAVEDNATVPLYYEARGEMLQVATNDINERMAEALEQMEIDDRDVTARLEQAMQQDYHVLTAKKRLDAIAKDFAEHYSVRFESGKAMLVCIDKITCVRLYDLIQNYWRARIETLERELKTAGDEQEENYRRRQIEWMRETRFAVIVSEEQGEVDKFRKWDLDITPHRALMKNGFECGNEKVDVETAFKDPDHPFRVAIVCAMWLTGFDVPSLSTLYLDKPLKAHTLMQAIARANRVYEGKNNGLIVDYCGILKNLRQALATFAVRQGGTSGGGAPTPDPVKPANEDLIGELAEAIALVETFLQDRGVRLDDIVEKTGFARNKCIADAKERLNENDATRKRFEIMARAVFKKFTACLTIPAINAYRHARDAVNILYKSLQEDRDNADISDIIRQLHTVVDASIEVVDGRRTETGRLFDISKIDFERLRQGFERLPRPNTLVRTLREVIETRLERMIRQNPLRADLQERYERIVEEYNREKDRIAIEKTFEELLRFVQTLDEEQGRAIREGLDEETLALYDLLKKDDLSPSDTNRLKKISLDLLLFLKQRMQHLNNWRANSVTRASVLTNIRDYLWDDKTGLPSSYGRDEVNDRADVIYSHIFKTYAEETPAT